MFIPVCRLECGKADAKKCAINTLKHGVHNFLRIYDVHFWCEFIRKKLCLFIIPKLNAG